MSEPVRPGGATALSEAEIQLLGTLVTAADQSEPNDRANLVRLGGRDYEDYLEDWSDAFDSLVGKGLLADRDGRYALTAEGARHASTCRAEMGIYETGRNINNKTSRGGFSAVFLLQCLAAIGATNLHLGD